MFNATKYLITVAELKSFSQEAEYVFLQDERDALINYLALNPDAGDVIPDTNGVRKLRWSAANGGRSGTRVVYYFRDLNMPVYLIGIYTSGESMRFTVRERAAMRALVNELVSVYAEQWATAPLLISNDIA